MLANRHPRDTAGQVFVLRKPAPDIALWLRSEARLVADLIAGRASLNEEQAKAALDRLEQAQRHAREWLAGGGR